MFVFTYCVIGMTLSHSHKYQTVLSGPSVRPSILAFIGVLGVV